MTRSAPKYTREGPMTYNEYAALPDDGYQYELVNRKLELMSPAPSTIHQLCVTALVDIMNRGCAAEHIILVSPIDVVFSDVDTRQPDLVMVRRSRLHIVKVRGVFGVPDLVVEVLSEGSMDRDRRSKLDTYSTYGVPEYWIVDPVGGTLEQYLHTDDGLRLAQKYGRDQWVTSPHVQCIGFTMDEVLAQIPPIED